ncbi:MAG: response regulator receiver modulated metal dependent phosphohydrolase [Herbinix sp.]|jgi:putative two-component system response regulator|nr:response regulator receiver modulated metal dependent phosphohydrolase [Herbinix sp.]
MENVTYNTPNILIVDDINANLLVLAEMIRNSGYIARPVTSVRQAMSAIEVLTPHLILLDITMPEIDGFEFCSILKKNANTKEIPIIFISALNSTSDKIRGYQMGAVDYISKPFEVEEVTLRINTHLKYYRMQQELEVYNKKLYKIINDQIRKLYEEQKNVLYALTRLTAQRDIAEEVHLERVGKNSRLLALCMQLFPQYENEITNSFIETIELTAPLHDIGMIAISDDIWHRAWNLNPEEQDILKTHCEIGANTLKDIYLNNENNEFIRMAINIASFHHENWDGTGYPKGLAGNEIPMCARIVSIINDYDILISERSYKNAFTHDDSVKLINDNAGMKYDPEIVHVFNKIQLQLKR